MHSPTRKILLQRAYDLTSYWSSVVSLILSCHVSETLEILYTESRFFDTPSLFRPKFQGVPLGIDPCCWGLWTANTPG